MTDRLTVKLALDFVERLLQTPDDLDDTARPLIVLAPRRAEAGQAWSSRQLARQLSINASRAGAWLQRMVAGQEEAKGAIGRYLRSRAPLNLGHVESAS